MCRCNNLLIDKLAYCHITQLFIMLEKLKEKVIPCQSGFGETRTSYFYYGEMFLPLIVKQAW